MGSGGSPGHGPTAEPWPVQLLTPYPDFPRLVFGRTAVRSAAFAANDAAGGQRVLIGSAAGTDGAEVAVRARGELTERVHNVLAGRAAEADPRAVIATHAALRRRGVPALDPLAWPELAARPAPVRETSLLWVPGESLTGGGQVLVPACAVFLAHRPPPGCAAPMRPGSAGVAAHRTRDAAVAHAALEVLERDLVWRAWYAGGRRPVIASGDGGLPLSGELAALGLTATALLLPGPGRTACVLACLHGERGTGQTFGARATVVPEPATAPDAAVRAAVFEALMVRWSLSTPAAQAARRRADRGGWRMLDGPLEHALYAFHRQDALARLLGGGGSRGADDPSAGAAVGAGEAGGPPGEGAARQTRTAGAAAAPPESPARLLAEHTGEDVVLVGTGAPGALGVPDGVDGDPAVVRVVAPGARRLPARERAGPPCSGAAPGHPPHPLG